MFPRILACAVVAAVLCPLLTVAVQPKELEDWFASSHGLGMTSQEAETLASQQWHTLTLCGTTVKDLQALKDVMYDPKGMDLGMAQLRKEILPLAEQHVSAEKLGKMFVALSSGYTISGGLSLPKVEAQERAISMLNSRAEPDELYALYKVMYGYSGLGFDQTTAQRTSISLAAAGADAGTFQTTYKKAKASGARSSDAIDQAQDAAVPAELSGLVRRYAKDAKPYTAREFQQYYGKSWFSEWVAGPMELRVSSDRLAHTASQFARHYGSRWEDTYRASAEATQKRLAQDGKSYTISEFQSYYGDSWQGQWATSPELPCSQCAPFGVVAPADLLV